MTLKTTPWAVFKHLSWVSLAAMLGLAVFGVFAIYSATYRGEDLPNAPFYWLQAVWISVGLEPGANVVRPTGPSILSGILSL